MGTACGDELLDRVDLRVHRCPQRLLCWAASARPRLTLGASSAFFGLLRCHGWTRGHRCPQFFRAVCLLIGRSRLDRCWLWTPLCLSWRMRLEGFHGCRFVRGPAVNSSMARGLHRSGAVGVSLPSLQPLRASVSAGRQQFVYNLRDILGGSLRRFNTDLYKFACGGRSFILRGLVASANLQCPPTTFCRCPRGGPGAARVGCRRTASAETSLKDWGCFAGARCGK